MSRGAEGRDANSEEGEKQKSLVIFLLSVLIKRPGGRTETGPLTDCLQYIVQPPHVSADTEQVLRG